MPIPGKTSSRSGEPSSANTLTWLCASFRYEAMNVSLTAVTDTSASFASGMIAFHCERSGLVMSISMTRPRGAARSVLNQNRLPSLSMNAYSASNSMSSSTIGAPGVWRSWYRTRFFRALPWEAAMTRYRPSSLTVP